MRFAPGLALILCGCFSKPVFHGGDGDTDAAAPGDGGGDAPCAFGAWSAPTPISELMNQVTGEPTMTRDRLLLYWSLQTGSGPERWEIHHATRSSPDGTFVVHGGATVDPAGMSIPPDPAITDDGLTMIYRSGTAGSPTFHQATRTSRSETQWSHAPLASLASERPASLDVSADGLTVYWAVGGQNLMAATRSSPQSDDFGNAGLLAQGIRWPSISGDQLTLYFLDGTDEVWQMTRPSPGDAFQPATKDKVFDGGKDPDVTSDGTAIVVGANNGVILMERACR